MATLAERVGRWRRGADVGAVAQEVPRPGAWSRRVLLCGWGAPWPPGASRFGELAPDDQAEAGRLWRGGAPALAAAWRAHGDWLIAEAARLGLPRRWSHLAGPAFYAEFVHRNMETGGGVRDRGQHE